MWSNHRTIIEFAQLLYYTNGKPLETVYFKKIDKWWRWGRRLHAGIIYNEHPFPTQTEARRAAEKELRQRYESAKDCVKAIKESSDKANGSN